MTGVHRCSLPAQALEKSAPSLYFGRQEQISRSNEPVSKKDGTHCLTAGVRRLHMDVLDVVLVVYGESFVYNVIAEVVDTRKAVGTMTITPVIYC